MLRYLKKPYIFLSIVYLSIMAVEGCKNTDPATAVTGVAISRAYLSLAPQVEALLTAKSFTF